MPSTYSEIHGNALHENTSRSTNRYGNWLITGDVRSNHSNSFIESDKPSFSSVNNGHSKIGALSVQHFSSTKLNSRKKLLSNSSNRHKTHYNVNCPSFKAEKLIPDCSQETLHHIKCSKGDIATNYFGSCKRFFDNKCDIRPSPYQTDSAEDKKQNFPKNSTNGDQNNLKSTLAWARKPSALNGNIMDIYDSAISFSDYLGNRSTSSSTPTAKENQRTKTSNTIASNIRTKNADGDFNTPAVTSLDRDTKCVSMKKDEDILKKSSHLIDNDRIDDKYVKQIQRKYKDNLKEEIQQDNEIKELKGVKIQSLYTTLRELADDNSYRTNFDKLQKVDLGSVFHVKKEDYDYNKIDNSRINNVSSSESLDNIYPKRFYKNVSKDCNSKNIRNILSTNEASINILNKSSQILNGYHSNQNSIEKNKNENEKENVQRIEQNILSHLSGDVGNLRHSLKQLDISHSGTVNFTEFRSAMLKKNVPISKNDLQTVFRGSAVDKRGRGAINEFELMSGDARYSGGGFSLNIEEFAEYMQQRAADYPLKAKAKEHCSGVKEGVYRSHSYSSDKELEQKQDKNENQDQDEEHSLVHQRAMKKILLASQKHIDPMCVFQSILSGEAKGSDVGEGTGLETGVGTGTRTEMGTGLRTGLETGVWAGIGTGTSMGMGMGTSMGLNEEGKTSANKLQDHNRNVNGKSDEGIRQG